MKTLKRQLHYLLLASMLGSALAHGSPLLTLSPLNGALAGPPGGLVGWGFTVSNPDPDYLVVTSANLCTTSVVGGITFCNQFASPSLGTFTDYIAQFNFIVVGPAPESSSVSQSFNQNLLTGIGSFAINPGALPGTSFNGGILLTYDAYSLSPNNPQFDPDTDLLSTGNTLTAGASVTASPEPATLLMLTGGLLAIGWRKATTRY